MLFSKCTHQADMIGFEDLGIIALVVSHLRKKLSILQLGISIEL
jgi:hypothetical protein